GGIRARILKGFKSIRILSYSFARYFRPSPAGEAKIRAVKLGNWEKYRQFSYGLFRGGAGTPRRLRGQKSSQQGESGKNKKEVTKNGHTGKIKAGAKASVRILQNSGRVVACGLGCVG